jgi:two-component system sensor histidine kinase CpxA
MRGNIFIKIFIGFWLVSITVLGSWMLAHEYFESLPRAEDRPPDSPEGPPHRFVLRMLYSLQSARQERLPVIAEEAREQHGIELYLLDRSGTDLLGRDVPGRIIALADRLKGPKRRVFERWKGKPLSVHEIYREDMGKLRLVVVFPESRHRVLGLLGTNLWLRLALAILISGLACYGLSRLMTNRLKDLQQASRKLARGDLDVRIDVRDRGGDETDELARDFNSMAGQLQQRMQAQKQLLSDVSHELRSPIARLRVALALAQEDPQQGADYLQRIEQETGRLEELIAQLLSSQQDSSELDKHIDLVALLRQLCADGSFEGEQENKRVTLHTAREQAVIASSGDLLHKCFENIIRNALRHTGPGSQVQVSLQLVDDGYQIAFEDEGPGVADDQLENIFDEFYRVDSARARESGGHGLGLAIARRAIELHGGSVKAENTGTGLRVVVNLPGPTNVTNSVCV